LLEPEALTRACCCSKDELKKARIALSKDLALTKRALGELKKTVYDLGCQLAAMQAEKAPAAAAAAAAPAPAVTGKPDSPQPVSS
jgi:hypothetical protein